MCALKWYVQSLYRHLFLVDISKHARVTQKWHFLIWDRPNSHAPWPPRPKLGTSVAKGLSCDLSSLYFFPGKLPLRYRAEKGQGHRICRNSVAPPLLSSISQGGGVYRKKYKLLKSQLRPLATLVPSLGRGGQGAWELGLSQIRKCHFWVTLACLDISTKKRCL